MGQQMVSIEEIAVDVATAVCGESRECWMAVVQAGFRALTGERATAAERLNTDFHGPARTVTEKPKGGNGFNRDAKTGAPKVSEKPSAQDAGHRGKRQCVACGELRGGASFGGGQTVCRKCREAEGGADAELAECETCGMERPQHLVVDGECLGCRDKRGGEDSAF